MKIILILLTFFSLLLSYGCTPSEENHRIDQIMNENYTKSGLNREGSPDISQNQILALAKDNTEFALEFYKEVQQKEGNLVFSPISLSLALSMTLAGAESATEEGMLKALQFSIPESDIYPTFNALLLSIDKSQNKQNSESEGNKFQLNIANSLWGQSGYDFESDFLDILAKNYGAGMYLVNYKENPEESREVINQWVEEETEEKISDLIPPGAINTLTRLVLANAIYFKGSWQFPFLENGTQKAPFFTLNGSEIGVDMMQLSTENLLYYRGNNFQSVDLPYFSNDFSMRIIVPDPGNFNEFEENLDSDTLINIEQNNHSQRINLQLPKFDYEFLINANDPLMSLGMSDAFYPNTANFSDINIQNELYITDVLHKATITVDEQGTEAAAATAVIMGLKSMPTEEPIDLTVDRPFIYLIQHKPTGSILFFGRVVEP